MCPAAMLNDPYLIAQLVGVTLVDRFRGEQKSVFLHLVSAVHIHSVGVAVGRHCPLCCLSLVSKRSDGLKLYKNRFLRINGRTGQ